MFFHIGKRSIIRTDTIIGIFNVDTIEISKLNLIYKDEIKDTTKSVIIDIDDEVVLSPISSITLIEREPFQDSDYLWKRSI
jgi:hypothetical protein